ncbi:hypothetical protein CPAV1605_1104 [seawater metagenome]|uniref:Uncharacterized protein n=1 Tax=seawater metagenome TaxID=1561972 RepID=A0A5E8CIZ1_9ZZZZ
MTSSNVEMIFRGHSSIGVKTNISPSDGITLPEYNDLTKFILPDGYNFITIAKHNCPVYSNTTEYFLLWGLSSRESVDSLLNLIHIKSGTERKKQKEILMNKMVRNFIIKIVSENKGYEREKFISSLQKYLSYEIAVKIWETREAELKKFEPKVPLKSKMVALESRARRMTVVGPNSKRGMTVLGPAPKRSQVPLESKPRMVPLESKPTAVPLESKPTAVPLESKPRMVPLESKPTAVPLESKPQVDQLPVSSGLQGSWGNTMKLKKAIFHEYITEDIVRDVQNDLNFTINIFKSGDLVPVMYIQNELFHDFKKENKRRYYYHGFFDLQTYLSFSSPLVYEELIPNEVRLLKKITEDKEKIKIEMDKITNSYSSFLDRYKDAKYKELSKELLSLDARENKTYNILQEKINIGLSSYNIEHDLPRDMKIEDHIGPITGVKHYKELDYFIFTFFNILKFMLGSNLSDKAALNKLQADYKKISPNILNGIDYETIGVLLFDEKDPSRLTRALEYFNNNITLINKLIELKIFKIFTIDNYSENLDDLYYIFKQNFFFNMKPGTYIFASCGSLDEDAGEIYAKLSDEERTEHTETIIQQQEQTYQKKYYIKY